jgi:hypothetical protein
MFLAEKLLYFSLVLLPKTKEALKLKIHIFQYFLKDYDNNR